MQIKPQTRSKTRYLASLALILVGCSSFSPAAAPPASTNPATVTAQREAISAILGDSPNFAASSNGDFLSVVSSPDGRGAKAGALVELYWPNLGEDHLWDAYSGVRYNGQFYWLHQFKLDKQWVEPDTDIIVSRFVSPDGKLQAELRDLVLRDAPVHVRNLTLSNRSNQALEDVAVFFYEYLTANLLPQGDHLEYVPASGSLHHYDSNSHFAIGMDKPPAQFQCGGVQNFLTQASDARKDAEDGKLSGNAKVSAYIGLGVNGTLATAPVRLAPGQSLSERSFIAAGANQAIATQQLQRARQMPWEAMVQQNQQSWQTYLNQSRIPAGLSPAEQGVYRRALIVLQQNSAATGAHLAAPTSTSPPYRFSWPRDGSFIALTQLQTGHPEETRKFLEFMARGQKSNGGWAINYRTDGRPWYDFGDRNNEHDEVGTIPWMMVEYARQTGQWSWLQQQWPVIRKACEFLLRYQDFRTGLIGPTRDLWELSSADTWTYSNAAVYAGFKAGAETARRANDSGAAQRYEAAAERIKQGIYKYLWDEKSGYYVRGINTDTLKLDSKVEAANLALVWPFAVFEAQDPRMQKMAEKISTDLATPQGGIRRYTDDRYYDGQPWPVTTSWLAIYYARLGKPDLARRLQAVNTSYAQTTGSLQLGEQYDEKLKRWVSATPLTWSEAKYILTALALENPAGLKP
jgi:glucoamylase